MSDRKDKSDDPAKSVANRGDPIKIQRPIKPAHPNATVIYPKGVKKPSTAKPKQLNASQAEVQLTRIRNAIREQDSSRGFAKAQTAADRALANNKIVLNRRFVLEATLGAGGMGTVYRAKDLRKVEASDPNPYVAIKVLNEHFKDHPDAFVTLQREASRSHTLSHPNIVTVHDFDRDGDVIFMTMELLQGQGLDTFIRQQKGKGVAKNKALQIVRDIGIALGFAHQKHIIHSDLKPGNVFLSQDGAKVLDFGIARLTSEAAIEGDYDAGTLGALTPAYASLEMLQGEPPHPADDIYALAIIAYELLAGEHPYGRKSAELALQENLKPKPLKCLNNYQWKVLAAGLKIKRSERTANVRNFYKGLTQKRRSLVLPFTAAMLVSAIVAAVGYRLLAGNQLAERIEQTYAKGAACLQSQNYICALDHAKTVLELDANHGAAKQLRAAAHSGLQEQQVHALLEEFKGCLEKGNTFCAEQVIQELQSIQGAEQNVVQLREVLRSHTQTAHRSEQMVKAQACFDQQDYACAIKITEQLVLQSQSPQAKELLNRAQIKMQQIKADLDARQTRFDTSLAKAEKCLNNEEFDCAVKQANIAHQTKIDVVKTQALIQRVGYAKSQHDQNLKKAKSILRKGERCFSNKNYSCATANAESAMEFVPNYPPAVDLKRRAKEAVDLLKSQIIIE